MAVDVVKLAKMGLKCFLGRCFIPHNIQFSAEPTNAKLFKKCGNTT